MKKKGMTLGLVILWICGCYFIGQQRNVQSFSENIQIDSSTDNLMNNENEKYENIQFEGKQEGADNPWNMTAGIFEMEGEGECIFLTPNTAALLDEIENMSFFSFCCEIHPWVRESSDGAGLVIWIMDREDTILHQEDIIIDREEDWKTIQLDLSLYSEAKKIKIFCSNGGNEDDSGDWVVLKLLEVENTADLSKNRKQEDFVIFSSEHIPAWDGTLEQNILQFGGVEPVLSVEKEGWDSSDVLNPSVILKDGIYYNYYSGWDKTAWRTGLATSIDGINWEKYNKNPILDIRENEWDNAYIAANGSAVLFQDKIYYFYQGISQGTTDSKIGLVVSENGKEFEERTKEAVLTVGESGTWDSAGVADPYVIEINGTLYLYYLGQDKFGVQRLGVAKSTNGKEWIKYANNPVMDVGAKGAFDERGLGEPSVIYQAPYFYMLYTGRDIKEQRNFGIAVSLDGVNWKKLSYMGMIEQEEDAWNSKVICDSTLIETENGEVMIWYGGGNIASPDENLNGRIGMFTISFAQVVDAAQFDVNDDWENSLISSMDFLKGSYEIEGKESDRYAWCSDMVSVVLEQEKEAEKIIVSGYLPMDLHQKIGKDEVKLSFYLNGEFVQEKIFSESEIFEVELKKSKQVKKEEYLELQIRVSSCVNPQEEQISEDRRELSWMIKKIWQK